MVMLDEKILTFQKQLENSAGMRLHLKINDNHSTMLSVKWEPIAKVSLHRMFLQAPKNIMQDLACYLKGKDRRLAPSIRAYIEDNLPKLDYSHQLNVNKLQTQGKFYNLQKIYDSINQEYFSSERRLHITWFGKPHQINRHRITFGLYHDPLKLIKVNCLLDNKSIPDYFISYVVYHEMLHDVCPAYVDKKGLKHIHSKEFKEKEKKFKHYSCAQKWIKDNKESFFSQYAS